MTRSRRAVVLTAAAILPLIAGTIWIAGALSAAVEPGRGAGAGPREIAIRVHAWGFSPSVVRVAPGQQVRFVVVSDDIRHGFAINELGLNLQLRPGQEVRAPAVDVNLSEGTYVIHCSTFCGLGHPSMKAKLVVGDPGPQPGARAPWVASLLTVAAVVGLALVVHGGAGRP